MMSQTKAVKDFPFTSEASDKTEQLLLHLKLEMIEQNQRYST